jgi:hypothetical protein
MLALIGLGGVALIYFLRSRSNTSTGPALTLVPDTSADESTIANLTQAALALQSRGHASAPSGGTSTPVTPTPTSPTSPNQDQWQAAGIIPPSPFAPGAQADWSATVTDYYTGLLAAMQAAGGSATVDYRGTTWAVDVPTMQQNVAGQTEANAINARIAAGLPASLPGPKHVIV